MRFVAPLIAMLLPVASAHGAADAPLDLLIRNGTIYDGTGAEPVRGDVGVRNGKIAFVGGRSKEKARQTIDATGLAVAPGFIDAHNHVPELSDATTGPLLNEQFLTQGVTTVLVSADGRLSPTQFASLASKLDRLGSGTNFACYVGYNGLRHEVMGVNVRAATAEELEAMKAKVRDGMRAGCVGLSTGLMYPPASFADTAEIIALAREVAPFGGTYDSHTRDPVMQMVASEKEAIDIGVAAGIPSKLAHLKAVGLINRGKIDEIIRLVERARTDGIMAVADQYPYDGAQTAELKDIFILPGQSPVRPEPHVLVELQSVLREARKKPEMMAQIRKSTIEGIMGFSWVKMVGWGSMRIVDAPGRPDLVDRNLELLAGERGQDPFDLAVDLILASTQPTLLTVGSIDEADVQKLLVQPWVMIASDGSPLSVAPHPRSTGTFTRVLGHYSRDLKLFPLQEAIRKMTSLPAEHLKLTNRGRLAPNYAADVTVFDPKVVNARSTYLHPERLSVGIKTVLVNGRIALADGKVTGVAAGAFVPRKN